MIHKQRLYTFLFTHLLITLVYGATIDPYQLSFSHIGLNQGLSQSTIFSITQDRQGNMWFATYDGVNKYDGYKFTVYQHDASDPHSISNDIIRVVYTDSRGRIWVGTRNTLSFYDDEKDRFINYFRDNKGENLFVQSICELSPDELLLATGEGLLVFNMAESRFTDEKLTAPMRRLEVNTLIRYNDHIYIGANNMLYLYSIPNKHLSLIERDFGNRVIQAILQQSPSRIWVGTEGEGLFLINPITHERRNYRHIAGDSSSITSNYIRSLALDDQNRLWIGTFNDLNIYNEGADSFISYSSNPAQSGTLSQNSVRSIFMDSQGGMWLGTYFGGLNYYHRLRNQFRHIAHISNRNSLNDNVVSCIVEEKTGNLWIGTNEGGVNFYDIRKKQFKYYTVGGKGDQSLHSNNVKSIYIDEDQGKVYIGTHGGGMSVLDKKSNTIRTYNMHNSGLNEDNVYSIIPAANGTLWVSTLSALFRFDIRQQRFEENKDIDLISGKKITTLFKDESNRLWIGTEEGVGVYREEHDGRLRQALSFDNTHPLNDAFINCINQMRDKRMWFGTREGVYVLNEETNQLIHYNTSNGLPNNVIYGILEDSFSRIWMSTNKGLCTLEPKEKKFRYFTEADGLQSNQFNSGAYCRTARGQIYFGGINGINSFMPELLFDNPYTPPVYISELQLFNKTIRPGDNSDVLTRHISSTSSIILTSKQNSFTLRFVVSNYVAAHHNTFAYKLENYDKEWYYLTDRQDVTYSNLPPGTYLFGVKAANNNGKWNEKATQLEITILPHWYQTWWATLFFTLIGGALLFFIFRYIWVRKSMKAQLEMERIDKERREEINQMKMRFFIDISHELRTPLTLIVSPLQEISQRVSDRWMRRQLAYIQHNTNRLMYLVNQLMDYRRTELGFMSLHVRKEDFVQWLKELFNSYEKLARNKQITYTLENELPDEDALFDPYFMELMLNNLLTNAFKFTPAGERISVHVSRQEGWLVVAVSDTGIGIPADKQDRVFDRFMRVNSEGMGTGIGLSLVKRLVELHHGRVELKSEVDKGSVFTLYIPQDITCYTPEEQATNQPVQSQHKNRENRADNNRSFLAGELPCDEGSDENRAYEAQEHKLKGTVLIVEDNAEIRNYLSEELGKFIEVATATNGQEALKYMKDHEVDIVVTDVMMATMDGIRLTKQIKQNIRTCHIPVIILSAKTEIRDQLTALKVGADDYIGKPFTIAILTTKIQNMLRARRRAYEHFAKSQHIEPEKITFNAMDEELLRRAVNIVKNHMDNCEFSVDEFAREMNMSRSNLHIKLKSITGESAIEFIRKIRFAEACRLLEEGRYSIAEVSTKVGFNTPSYFATSFKKYFGYLPTEYIRNRRG